MSGDGLRDDRAGHTPGGPVILVTSVGAATGSKAAAAALACAGSEPDRAGLLIDLAGGRAPRPALIAAAAARELEERLAVHLPEAGVASRGQLCQLNLPAGANGIDGIAAALPTVRDSVAVVHLSASLLQQSLDESRIPATAALLRADLGSDRALTALAARDLIEHGLRVAVLKRPLGWLDARRALFGALPAAAAGLPPRIVGQLLERRDRLSHECYSDPDDAKAKSARAPQQERRDHASPRRGGELHRHPQRGAGR